VPQPQGSGLALGAGSAIPRSGPSRTMVPATPWRWMLPSPAAPASASHQHGARVERSTL